MRGYVFADGGGPPFDLDPDAISYGVDDHMHRLPRDPHRTETGTVFYCMTCGSAILFRRPVAQPARSTLDHDDRGAERWRRRHGYN